MGPEAQGTAEKAAEQTHVKGRSMSPGKRVHRKATRGPTHRADCQEAGKQGLQLGPRAAHKASSEIPFCKLDLEVWVF